MKHKQLVIGLIIISIVIGGVSYYYSRPKPNQAKYMLTLKDIPSTYCPKSAEVAIENKSKEVVYDKTNTLLDCRYIVLNDVAPIDNGYYTIKVKVPSALGFEMPLVVPLKGDIVYSIQLGDANRDNVIDQLDLDNIKSNLFAGDNGFDMALDIDDDGKVTVVDYSLAKQNQGAGVNKLDKTVWDEGVL